jgi:hypothetical protein
MVILRSLVSAAARNRRSNAGRTWGTRDVAGPVEVGRHRRDEVAAVLLAIGLALHQPRNLGDGVPLIGRLQRSSKQRRFADRLRREARIDARRSQEDELAHADFGGDVRLQSEIVVEEIRRAAGVCRNAADPRRREDDHVGLCLVHPRLDLGLAPQVEPGAIDGQELAVLAREPSNQCGTDHAAMACDPDAAPLDAERQCTPGHNAVSPSARAAGRIPSFRRRVP